MKLLLLGPPGAGKGTQARRLSQELNVPHLSAGDLLRKAVKEETDAGKRAKPYIDQGKLVPVEVVVEIMTREMFEVPERDGFVVDGFPRNLDQYRELNDSLEEKDETLDRVIDLELPEEEIMKRLTGRRICEECGKNYHVEFNPPEEDNKCNVCGGSLYRREDDTPETIRHRLEVFREESQPVAERFREDGLLEVVDATGPVEEVFRRVLSVVSAAGSEQSHPAS